MSNVVSFSRHRREPVPKGDPTLAEIHARIIDTRQRHPDCLLVPVQHDLLDVLERLIDFAIRYNAEQAASNQKDQA